jgi:hypothetical protein
MEHCIEHGLVDLEFVVLEYCEDDILVEREQYYLLEHYPCFNSNVIAKRPGDVENKCTPTDAGIINYMRCGRYGCIFREDELAPEIIIPIEYLREII